MKGHILLVDDDPAILRYCTRLLTHENYEVTACSSAARARAAINSGVRCDVLVTDFYLGDGFGPELITHIKQRDPSVKTLIITGDERLAGTRGPGPGFSDAPTLLKPFPMEDLLASIGELIEAKNFAGEKAQ